ncbi:hypothetical protein L5515_005216 [Caenorhabditis briggsae]|uniref:Serine/threonine-protein phosphatase n=1 Tax=Caenorhabditis briggsae TaxID=6238 RepID=A0AAE9EMJ6_CAEBR|nr:hypothetical protein L5515_005216 [Caenorhabditis briggsae]
MADGSRQKAAVEARSRPARSVKKERQVAVSPMNRRIRNTSNILNERDERPGGIMKDKSMVHSMAKTQPVSERQTVRLEDLTRPISIKNNAEIQAAVEIQNRLQKKMARNSERRRKMTHASETTAQNRTQERIDFVEFANKHYHIDYLQNGVHKMRYSKEEYENIIYEAQTIFSSEKALVDIDPPCVVVGDLHGQYNDLINMFILLGRPPETVYVFTGDYVDRGMMSLECIMLLFTYKICYPEHIVLLRGNHEIARVNKKYGFYDECLQSIPKYGEEIWAMFQRCFNNLPISALIATKILCMHGGLSPSLITLDDLRNHPKPIRNPFRGIVNDMLWADPDPAVFEWKTSARGSGFVFGTNVIDDVCARLDVELIVRAHQMCFDGYWVVSGKKLITIFSAPMYCNLYKNAGCVLKVDDELGIQMVAFVPESPKVEQVIEEKNRVWDFSFDNIE